MPSTPPIQLELLRTLVREAVHDSLLRDYFAPGDEVLFGKWKNKRGRIVAVYEDDRGIPTIEVQRGRRRVAMALYNVRRAPPLPDDTI